MEKAACHFVKANDTYRPMFETEKFLNSQTGGLREEQNNLA